MHAQKNSKNQNFCPLYTPPIPLPAAGAPVPSAMQGREGLERHRHTTYHADLKRMLVDIAKRIETGGV